MNSFPAPALAAALAAFVALPFSLAAAGTLLFTAALGCVIHADYVQRYQRVRLPRLAPGVPAVGAGTQPTICRETHQLAA